MVKKKTKKSVIEDMKSFIYCLQIERCYDDLDNVREMARWHVGNMKKVGLCYNSPCMPDETIVENKE